MIVIGKLRNLLNRWETTYFLSKTLIVPLPLYKSFQAQTLNINGEYFQPYRGFSFSMQVLCVYVRKHKSFVIVDITYRAAKKHG